MIEAVLEVDGSVRLLDPMSVSTACRALLIVLDESPDSTSLTERNVQAKEVGHYPRTGADLVAYWERQGLIGSRPDIIDPADHAQRLRGDAATRRRL